jgi:hypothetical protein
MGPMGPVVLTEQVKLYGATLDRFPREKVSGLIDSVSREIFDEAMRERFRKRISDGVRAIAKG